MRTSSVWPPVSSRKYSLNSQSITPSAIALSMIVEITSCTPRSTLSTAAIDAQNAAGGHRHEADEDDMQRVREVDVRAGDRGPEHAEQELALDADVEQVHLEPDRHGDAGDDQRGRPIERLEQLVLAEPDVEHRLVGGERILPGDGQEHAADRQRQQHRCDRAAQREPTRSTIRRAGGRG